MAGQRIGAGPQGATKRKRSVTRRDNWRARIAQAVSSEQLYDTASDWYRAIVKHVPDEARRTQLLNEAGRYLSERADQLAEELIR